MAGVRPDSKLPATSGWPGAGFYVLFRIFYAMHRPITLPWQRQGEKEKKYGDNGEEKIANVEVSGVT
jgi:hypothetical protein